MFVKNVVDELLEHDISIKF